MANEHGMTEAALLRQRVKRVLRSSGELPETELAACSGGALQPDDYLYP